jgi:hypothetical protein
MMWQLKNSNRLKSQTGLQIWEILMMMIMMTWTSTGLGKVLERI